MDRACQHYHETGDAHRALVMMPRKCEVERTILRVLERQARYHNGGEEEKGGERREERRKGKKSERKGRDGRAGSQRSQDVRSY